MKNKKMKAACILCAVFLSSILFASLGNAEEITYSAQTAFPKKMTMEKMLPLGKYLEEDTGLEFTHVIPKNSKDLIMKVGTGEIKMAFICGGHIERINRQYKDMIRPLVIGVGMNGKTTHRNQIVVRADSDIKNIEGIKGKKVEATSPYCISGYVPQAAYCLTKGIDVTEDTELTFVSGYAKPANIMNNLILNKCDVGFLKAGMLEMMAGKINTEKLRVLDTSTYDIPNWIFVVHKDVDAAKAEKIKQSLMKLDPKIPEQKKILKGLALKGFTEVKTEDLAIVKSLFDNLGI